MATKEKDKEKEQAEKMKALRRELEEKLEEQMELPVTVDEKTRVEVQRIDENQQIEPEQAKRIIEALLFATAKPLTVAEIRKVMKSITPKDIEAMIHALREEYAATGRSFEIVEIAGGYEMASKKEYAPWILKVELQKKAKQVTQSALETLAILAYKQPITRAEIEDLRGVDVSGVMTTLVERGLIKIVGRKEVPGRPFMYGTTEKFLEHFGLKSLNEMPNIQDIKSIVENSVKKEELLGTQKMVDVPQEGQAAEEGADPDADMEPAELGKPQAFDAETAAEIADDNKEEIESAEEE